MTPDEAPDPLRPDLDRIREQLREKGYLRGPLSRLDRFVLAGRGGPSSFVRINAMASLRAGLLGGPLLGLPAAMAVWAGNRPHLSSARDLFLLAVYLSGALGLLLGLLEFVVDLALAFLARRGLVLVGAAEKLAARVGLLFFSAATLYLALLLRSGRAGSAGSGPMPAASWVAWSAGIIAVLAAGHAVGRLVRLGSLAALAASWGGRALPGPAGSGPPIGRRGMMVAVILVVGLAALLVLAPHDVPQPSGESSPFQPREVEGRVILVGIDGLTRELLDQAGARQALPAFRTLAQEGAGYPLRAEGSRVPPAVWTSVATGRTSSEHGILGYQARHLTGLAGTLQDSAGAAPARLSLRLLIPALWSSGRPVSGALRRAPAVWEILASRGVESAVINWWATWPALPQEGIVVSDRAFARLAARRPADRDIAPSDLAAALEKDFPQDLDEVRLGLEEAGLLAEGEPIASAATIDGYHGLIAARLMDLSDARLMMVYLPGLDIAGKAGSTPPAAMIGRIDSMLTRLIRQMERDDILILLAEPGRAAAGEGFVQVWGRRVRPGDESRVVSDHDIAPTLLALCGFPVARDLEGAPLLDFLMEGDPGREPIETIDTYGTRAPRPGEEDPGTFDEEMLERLRSLGYIR